MMNNHPASFYVAGGTMRPDAPCYVERKADTELLEALARGEFCYVLHARQMGKSSLMVRARTCLRDDGIRVAVLDLTQIGQNLSVEQWYGGLLINLGDQLDLADELDDFWAEQSRLGPLQRFMAAVEHVVLGGGSSGFRVQSSESGAASTRNSELGTRNSAPRLVIFIDEIDVVRSLPFSTDEFFAAIRECYNRRAREPEFERLTFCLLGVASPSDLIQDPRTTPFNIGRRIELGDFDAREAGLLAVGLTVGDLGRPGRPEQEARLLLRRVLYWTGGHPFLTQRFCQALAADPTVRDAAGVDRLCRKLFLEHGAEDNDDNLSFVRERILRSRDDLAGLLDLYAQVRARAPWAPRVPDDETNPLVTTLKLSGIVRTAPARRGFPGSGTRRGSLSIRNRIYARVFDRSWIAANMPDAELRRQRAAYRRGAARSGGVFGVALVATAMALVALNQHQQARLQRENARAIQYAQSMNLAQAAVHERNYTLAGQLLDEQRPRRGESDLRGFEWRYLWRLCHTDRLTLAGVASAPPFFVAFGEGGRTLVTGHDNVAVVTLVVWDSTTGQRIDAFEALPDPGAGAATGSIVTPAFALSPEGRTAAMAVSTSGGPRGPADAMAWKLVLIDLASRRLRTLRGREAIIGDLAFSPDGGTLAIANRIPGRADIPGTITLVAVASGRVLATLRDRERTRALAYSPRGDMVATGSREGTIRLWNVATRRLAGTLAGRVRSLHALTFTPDGRQIILGSQLGMVMVGDVATGEMRPIFRAPAGGISCLTVSPDGATLVAGTEAPMLAGVRGRVLLWDLKTGRQLPGPAGHTDSITSVAVSPDGRSLATASADGTAKLWPLFSTPNPSVIGPLGVEVASLAFTPDDRVLATALEDGAVDLWDVRTALRRARFRVPPLRWISFSADGRTLALGTLQGALLRDLSSDRHSVRIGSAPVAQLEFAGAGDRLIILDGTRAGTFWDLTTGRAMPLGERPIVAYNLAVSGDGRVAALGGDRATQLWDVTARRPLRTLAKEGPGPLALSRDGRMIAGAEENVIRLSDVAARESTSLRGHLWRVSSLAFAPDGPVRLWHVRTRQEVAVLEATGEGNPVIAFSHDGSMLAGGGRDGRIRIWRAASAPETEAMPAAPLPGAAR